MRRIERATLFRRDYRRTKATSRYRDLDQPQAAVLELLVNDRPLPPGNRDHALSGNWSGYRDCHLWPDLPDNLRQALARRAPARQARVARRAVRLAAAIARGAGGAFHLSGGDAM